MSDVKGILNIKGVNKFYGKFQALKDVHLSVEEGEFVAILGESGSGKSTLLNVISGLDRYDSGEITINGMTTKDFSQKEWAVYRNNYVGFVFQEYNLVDHLTVVENVELPLLLQGIVPKVARERAIEKCKLLGLKNHTHKLPSKISGGQQQRTAIARALVTNPKVILADEPTGALDSENAVVILDILKVLSKDHIVILVTHDEDFANQYATRIVTLEDGMIISDTDKRDYGFENTTSLNLKYPNMKLKVLWKFAKNNLKKRMIRTFFTALTMSIGLISIFLIVFLVNGIRNEVTDFVEDIIPEDQYYVKSEINHTLLNEEDYAFINQQNEVTEAYFQYTIRPLTNNLYGNKENYDFYDSENYRIIGIPNLEKHYANRNNLIGDYPKNENEIIITTNYAETLIEMQNLSEKDFKEDVILDLILSKTITVERVSSRILLSEKFKIVGIIYDQNQNEVYLKNSKVEKMAQAIEEDDIDYIYYGDSGNLVDKRQLTIFLNTNDNKKIDDLEENLTKEGLVLKNPVQEVYGSINNFFDTVLYILLGTAAVSLLVAGILVGLMIYVSVIERIKEIGILKSIGAKARNIRSLFIFESGFIGLLSSFIALVISLLITLLINMIFNSTIGALFRTFEVTQFEEFKLLHIDVLAIIIVFGVSIIYSVICGLIPAIIASRLDAVEALRKE